MISYWTSELEAKQVSFTENINQILSHFPNHLKLPIISYPPSAQQIKEDNITRHNAINITRDESTRILMIKIDQLKESMDEEYEDWIGRIKKRIMELKQKNRASKAAESLTEQLRLVDVHEDEDPLEGLSYEKLIVHYSFIDTTWLALRDDLYLNWWG